MRISDWSSDVCSSDLPKSRASITQEFIGRQAPGHTILDSLNLLPGVNFTNNDAFGSAGGDITLRGFDSQRVALLQDGVPLNDSGNSRSEERRGGKECDSKCRSRW